MMMLEDRKRQLAGSFLLVAIHMYAIPLAVHICRNPTSLQVRLTMRCPQLRPRHKENVGEGFTAIPYRRYVLLYWLGSGDDL
jgi:hypothetical protein